jgi:hypothetical protein
LWRRVYLATFRGQWVSCETWVLQFAVIPAKAGIYSAILARCAVFRLDSRFRGNDQCFEKDPTLRDTRFLRVSRWPRGQVISTLSA